jgi:hypothetical protein
MPLSDRTLDAIARAEAGADEDWKEEAWDALIDYLHRHPMFFVDDYWRVTGVEKPREPRVLGALVVQAKREGLIEGTGQYRSSEQNNTCPKPVWRSLIYRSVAPQPRWIRGDFVRPGTWAYSKMLLHQWREDREKIINLQERKRRGNH